MHCFPLIVPYTLLTEVCKRRFIDLQTQISKFKKLSSHMYLTITDRVSVIYVELVTFMLALLSLL